MMSDKEARNLEDFLTLLNMRKKRDVDKFLRDFVLDKSTFANAIIAGRLGALQPYNYQCNFRECVPEHLELSDDELQAFGASKKGTLEGKALKAVRKIGQTFDDRKLLCVHLFYTECETYWHLFYFDQRDRTDRKNHWSLGPHIHYVSDTFTNARLADVWNGVQAEKPSFPRSVHVKWSEHRHRAKSA